MLFANAKVIEAVERDYVAAWQSVAPVRVDDFDLGDGTMVRAAWGGNIALYFCTPEGEVLDVLPGLHDPTTVVRELERAKELAKLDPEGLKQRHRAGAKGLVLWGGAPGRAQLTKLEEIARKSAVVAPRERIDIVTPGGYEGYKQKAHAVLAARLPARPAGVMGEIYELVLGEPLGEREKPDIRKEPVSLMLVE